MASNVESIFVQSPSLILAALIGLWVVLIARSTLYRQILASKYPLPPGPKGSPIIGNIRQVPPQRSDLQFAKWANEYDSDVIYVNLLGQPVIVLNSVESAVVLLEKRGSSYSGRPSFAMLEALGFKPNLALMNDDAQFRKVRKAYGNFLSARSSLEYRDVQMKHAAIMASDIEKCPEKWLTYLSQFATRVIFSMAFAIDLKDENDHYFNLADQTGEIISNMGNNTLTIVDLAPWVRHLPHWIGKHIPSVRYVQDHAPTVHEFHQRPFDTVMNNFKAGTLRNCFLGRLVEAREKARGNEEDAMKTFTEIEIWGTGGSLFSAGQDTTFSTETIFVMAMVLNPKVQIQAQREIDAVIGRTRLPTFEDYKALPIVERTVYETLRFHPAVPNGVPHKTNKEDVYRDMYIPKGESLMATSNEHGSIVIANGWAMLHNPNVYKDPHTFDPDRYLPKSKGGNGEPLPVGHFGFGRRICPGQYLGFASIWIVVATILAKFNISPAKDKDGKDIMPVTEYTTGITRFDKIFFGTPLILG